MLQFWARLKRNFFKILGLTKKLTFEIKMNLQSNISVGYDSLGILSAQHGDNASLVSLLPKDVVNLIGSYLPSFTKISEETLCARELKILFVGESEEQGAGSHQASEIVARYNSTEIKIKGISYRISAFDGSSISRDPRNACHYRGSQASVYLLGSTIEYPRENLLLKSPNQPTILAWKKMQLNETQREGLKNLRPNFSTVEFGENSDFLLLKTIEKLIELRPEIFPEKEETPPAALAARSASEKKPIMGDCMIQ